MKCLSLASLSVITNNLLILQILNTSFRYWFNVSPNSGSGSHAPDVLITKIKWISFSNRFGFTIALGILFCEYLFKSIFPYRDKE